jgi:hypothetical protein
VPNKIEPLLNPPLINEVFVNEKAKATSYFDSYTERMDISPNPRNPATHDSQFENIDKMPQICSKYRKTGAVDMGRTSPRFKKNTTKDASRFYDTSVKSSLAKLNKGSPKMESSLGHDPSTYAVPCSPDGTIDYKRAVDA